MPRLILNNSYADHPDAARQDAQIRAFADASLAANGLDVTLGYARSFEQLGAALDDQDDVRTVFTNAPPDHTFVGPLRGARQVFGSSIVHMLDADGYGRAKEVLRTLASRHPEVRFAVVTGASAERLTDNEIEALGEPGQLEVYRKRALLASGAGFAFAYAELIVRKAAESVGRRGGLRRPVDPQAGRVLFLDRPLMRYLPLISKARPAAVVFLCQGPTLGHFEILLRERSIQTAYLGLPVERWSEYDAVLSRVDE